MPPEDRVGVRAIVRPLIGYDRDASRAAYAQLAHVYALARLHINVFQPVQKLVTKERRGPRVHRVYDRAQTPYQRLGATGVLAAPRRQELEVLSQRLNPLHLRRALETALERLWTLAVPPVPPPPVPRENAPAGDRPVWPRAQLALLRAHSGPRSSPPAGRAAPALPERVARPARRHPHGLTLEPHGPAPSPRGPG
jgi:hypothetical protein